MQPLLVLNIVGLTPSLLNSGHMPRLHSLAQNGAMRPIAALTPAVTCTMQSTFLTGEPPDKHGIVGNGWYFHELHEVRFWHQSNRLVSGEKVWEVGKKRDPRFTCANLFWWYNMYSSVDYSVTPRPIYKADGRKIPDCYSAPSSLRDELTRELGPFPLFQFWGPGSSIASSRWIADAARYVMDKHNPTLSLVYLPHLDYSLQSHGPDSAKITEDLSAIDNVSAQLIEWAQSHSRQIIVLSEYGITPVSNPIHVNRALREAGLLAIREEQGLELLDPGASQAFAVADHQIAHIYVKDQSNIPRVKAQIEKLPGVERVLDQEGKQRYGLDHPRSGDLIAVADATSWFTYYHWLDDRNAPDYARTVDIHRKPGYDPVELFIDPKIKHPKIALGWRLLKKKLGFRTLMDIIPLDATLVRGSHCRPTDTTETGPLIISSDPALLDGKETIAATDIKSLMLTMIFDD